MARKDTALEHLSISLQEHAKALLDQVDALRFLAHRIDSPLQETPTSREVLDALFTGDGPARVASTLHRTVVFNDQRAR